VNVAALRQRGGELLQRLALVAHVPYLGHERRVRLRVALAPFALANLPTLAPTCRFPLRHQSRLLELAYSAEDLANQDSNGCVGDKCLGAACSSANRQKRRCDNGRGSIGANTLGETP
jgi:hypothetical protein